MEITQDIYIPSLRQDLLVYSGGYDLDGSPTWTLYDPVSDNYFKIGWFEFECLQRFKSANTAGQLAKTITEETSMSVDLDEVKDFVTFLALNGLLIANTPEVQKMLTDVHEDKSPSFVKKFFTNYIFMSIPLFKPEGFLRTTYPYIKFLFTRSFFYVVLTLLFIGLFLTFQRWDDFVNSFTSFFSLQGFILVIVSTIIIKIFHELGHAFMAHKFGVPVTTMGVVLIVLYPILYTETTNAWRLYDRRKRIYIASAGLLAELTLASFALIVWHISSPGLVQNAAYFVAFLSLILSIFVNSNPLMKFDGYYLLSDLIGIDNLQNRSVAFFKWKMRHWVLGFEDDMPEPLHAKTVNFLTIFGLSLTIYRFFLYVGIGLLIYVFFFKPVGLILMLIALGVFIGMPIAAELQYWFQERKRIMQNTRPKIILAAIVLVLFIGFLPIHNTVKLPAVMHAQDYTAIYSPVPAKIDSINVRTGQNVEKGDLLFSLSSEALTQDIQVNRAKLEVFETIKERQQGSAELSRDNITIEERILQVQTLLDGLLEHQEKLQVTAPFSGKILDISPEMHVGRWINKQTVLGRLVNTQNLSVTGYANSSTIERVEIPAYGIFRSDAVIFSSFDVELTEVSASDTKNILHPELSSLYGGIIPSDDATEGIISRKPLYTLRFKVSDSEAEIDVTEKGIVILDVSPNSYIGELSKKLISLFIRETGI